MGWYRDRVFPRLIDAVCDTGETRRIRAEVCAPLTGRVLEVGFGTGLNLPHLPPTVDRLLAVDPMERGRELAADRLAHTPVPVDFVGLDGQSLALPDASVDAALMTWTLCSVDEPAIAVGEIRRVLRPGGVLHFVEHGHSPDPSVARWQRRLNGVQNRLAGGCHLDREIDRLISAGGMAITRLDTFYSDDSPKFLGWTFRGRAVSARS